MKNHLNKLTLKQDDLQPARSPAQPCRLPESNAFRFQILFNLLTIVMIMAAIAIPYLIEGTYFPRTPVDSSDIVSIGHNSKSQKLVIEFKGGRIYEYADVPTNVYDELMGAESHGGYFYREIKNAGYEFKQVK